jgi:hypothetical protein
VKIVAQYTAVHQPATPEEESLVKEMIAAHWRIQRLWSVETSIIDLEMIRQEPEVEKEFSYGDPGNRSRNKSRSLSLISR